MDFHCCLSDNKSPQVSRILLTIQADLDKAIVWMVPTRLMIIIIIIFTVIVSPTISIVILIS